MAESACQHRRPGFDPWVGKIPWRRKWQPTPRLLPRTEEPGRPQPMGLQKNQIRGEGNGNPLQYPCLRNPMKGGAWQATVHGVTPNFILAIFHFSSQRGTPQLCELRLQWIWTDPWLKILKKDVYSDDAHRFYICTEDIHTKSCTQKNDSSVPWKVKSNSSYVLGTWENIFSHSPPF